jgi:glycosyltransferase involved in cell wall biosynthesis
MTPLLAMLKGYLQKWSQRYLFLRIGIGLVREFKSFLNLLTESAPTDRPHRSGAHNRPNIVEVEYVGWLPIFRAFGDCGRHPQFEHIRTPPDGIRFSVSRPRSILACVKRTLSRMPSAVGAELRLMRRCYSFGARIPAILVFLMTRGFLSQLLVPKGRLLYLPSVPYTYGQQPWIIEIEDPTTLFYPFLLNGHTAAADPVHSPFFRVIKCLLESDNCRGIITHVKSTADNLSKLFSSETLAAKVTYVPMGVNLPPLLKRKADRLTFNLLFTASWHQDPRSFIFRGGLDVIEAFAVLTEKYPNLRLTLRTALPSSLSTVHKGFVRAGHVTVMDKFLPQEEWSNVWRSTDAYLLPAARIHVLSILEAMSHGLPVIVSDGWGIEEYVTHTVNGLVVKGRYSRASWVDYETGALKEDYSQLLQPDPSVVKGIIDAVSALIEDPALCNRLGEAARQTVEKHHTIETWNQGLGTVLRKAIVRRCDAGTRCESPNLAGEK